MKKVERGLSKNYTILRLYKSDVEKIFDLFKEQFKKIDVIADGFELEDFSELSKIKKQEITDLEIVGRDHYISLEFSRSSARIYLSDEDNVMLRGLLEKIEEILSERKSPLRFIAQPWLPGLCFNVLFWLMLWYFPFKEYKVHGVTLLILMVLGFALLFVWGFRLDLKKHSIIYLYEPSALGFFKRNKDNIILAIMSGVFGGIITLIIGLVSKLF